VTAFTSSSICQLLKTAPWWLRHLSWLSRLFGVFLHRLSVNTNNSYKAIILLNNITICLVTFGIKIKLLTRIISPSFFFPSCHAPATYVNSRAHMSGAHHPRHGRSIIHRRCVASSTGKGKTVPPIIGDGSIDRCWATGSWQRRCRGAADRISRPR
jgi:hypothetical protein